MVLVTYSLQNFYSFFGCFDPFIEKKEFESLVDDIDKELQLFFQANDFTNEKVVKIMQSRVVHSKVIDTVLKALVHSTF